MTETVIGGDAPATLPLQEVRGNDWEIPLEFVDDDTGDPLDWSGSTFAAQLRLYENGPLVATFTIDTSLFVSDSRISLTMAKALTATLADREHVWDLQRTDATGKVSTPLKGPFIVIADVTRLP